MALVGCYMINLKFTGPVYFVLIMAALGIVAFINHRTSLVRHYLKIGALTVVMGLFVFGYHPYITNLRGQGHPVFPLMGRGKVDIMTTVGPREFDNGDMSRTTKLLLSLWSKSTAGKTVRPKVPFQIKEGELFAFYNPDVRLGGFGPLFSGILLLSSGLLIYWAITRQGNRNLYAIPLLILASVLANPEAWWARYAPQLWLVPVVAAIFAIGFQKRASIRTAGSLLALLILVNIVLVGAPYLYHQLKSRKVVLAQLRSLQQRGLTAKVEFLNFRSNRVRLTEHGISYLEQTGIRPENSTSLYASETKIQSE